MHAEKMSNTFIDCLCIGYGFEGTCSGDISLFGALYYRNGRYEGDGDDILNSRILEYDIRDNVLVRFD